MSLNLLPNRNYPNTPSITDDPKSHSDALRSITEALNIGQRRTSDILNSFIRVNDLIDLGIITLTDGNFAGAVVTPATPPAAHTHDHGTELTGLVPDDDHTQYVKKAGDVMSGTLNTELLYPNSDLGFALGDPTFRYASGNFGYLQVFSGSLSGGATIDRNFNSSILGGYLSSTGGGTATLRATSPLSTQFCLAAGSVISSGAGAAVVEATGNASLCVGFASSSGDPASVRATGTASLVMGQAQHLASTGGGSSDITAAGAGCAVIGQTLAIFSGVAVLSASGAGCFAAGYASDVGGGSPRIEAAQTGAFVSGYAAGLIKASGYGSLAGGYCLSYTVGILASGDGSFARGRADSGLSIQAIANGTFAFGYAITANIIASALNATQFGMGINAVADSLKVGNSGIRLRGTAIAGAPAAVVNGDIWVSNLGKVGVQAQDTNLAASVQVTLGPVNAWTLTGAGALRNFTGLTTAAQALQVLETLVTDLRAANLI